MNNKLVNNVEIRLARAYVPGGGNGDKIGLCYPRVPMSLECLFRDSSVLQLPKRPFINNVGVVRVVEQAGGNPGLADDTKVPETRQNTIYARKKSMYTYFDHEPSAEADTADLLRPILEARAERENCGKTGGEESRGESKLHRCPGRERLGEAAHTSIPWAVKAVL